MKPRCRGCGFLLEPQRWLTDRRLLSNALGCANCLFRGGSERIDEELADMQRDELRAIEQEVVA